MSSVPPLTHVAPTRPGTSLVSCPQALKKVRSILLRPSVIVATRTLGSGWNAFTALFQAGDFSGDRRADLVAVDSLGKLWLYPGNGRGGFGARTQIGTGWAGFGAVLPLRDFNGDGRADIGAITTDGRLLMYPGNGRSGFLAP